MQYSNQIINFAQLAGKLKFVKRKGWTQFKEILEVESVADHSYRIGLLALVLKQQQQIDINKCIKLALVHDLAEAEVGDITPSDGISKEEKQKIEFQGFNKIISPLDQNIQKELLNLWQEYEDRNSIESKIVKDLDIYEMLQQAYEYEQKYKINLQEFFEDHIKINNQEIKLWAQQLISCRQEQQQNLKENI